MIKGENISIDLHRASPMTGPTLTRVLIGDAQPNRRLVGPRRAVPYIEEVGTTALDTRFAAVTVPHRPNPRPIARGRCGDGKLHRRRTIAIEHAGLRPCATPFSTSNRAAASTTVITAGSSSNIDGIHSLSPSLSFSRATQEYHCLFKVKSRELH